MTKKTAHIERVPAVGKIIASAGDTVEWNIDASENTEFEIFFPAGKDPLVPNSSTSSHQTLTRQVLPNAVKGKYQYKIKLIRTGEDVISNSPPEMVIQ